MIQDQFLELLDRYLAGKSTEAERALLFKLYEEMEQRSDFDVTNQLYEKQLEQDLIARFKNETNQPFLVPGNSPQRQAFKIFYGFKPMLAAAALIMCVAVAAYFLRSTTATNNQGNNHNQAIALGKASNLAQTEKSSNDHRRIKLQDGSVVTLNKHSQLVYPLAFSGKTREVTLIGEGYFDIKHDTSKPFLVHAGGLTITVLGTAFNINTAGKVAVTVTRGKVSVSRKTLLLGALTPGQQISFDADKNEAKRITLNADRIIQWQANDLFFENTTMADAAAVLERRFHKKIVFENDAVRSCTFTASFTHGQTLQEILKVISAFNNADFEEKAEEIIIKGKGC